MVDFSPKEDLKLMKSRSLFCHLVTKPQSLSYGKLLELVQWVMFHLHWMSSVSNMF